MRFKNGLISIALGLVVALTSIPASGDDVMGRDALIGKLVPITGDVQRSVDLTVPFTLGSAKLTPRAVAQLRELGAALGGLKLRGFKFGVYGHTDASGAAEYNLKLSKQRAAAVVDYLVHRAGLDPRRIEHDGYGEGRLLEGLNPSSFRNRRVEIIVFAPKTRSKQMQKPATDRNKNGGFQVIN